MATQISIDDRCNAERNIFPQRISPHYSSKSYNVIAINLFVQYWVLIHKNYFKIYPESDVDLKIGVYCLKIKI